VSYAVQRETEQHTTHNHKQAHSKQHNTHTQKTRHVATAPKATQRSNSMNVLNYNFSIEQYMLPEDDRTIETCRSVLNVLM
jgi:hypothetical protein